MCVFMSVSVCLHSAHVSATKMTFTPRVALIETLSPPPSPPKIQTFSGSVIHSDPALKRQDAHYKIRTLSGTCCLYYYFKCKWSFKNS